MPAPPDPPPVDYESTPLTRAEYIAAIVHLYRGELHRANAWRLRLDLTTNWAVLTTAGMLTFAFGDPAHSHWALLGGMGLVTVFHGFEARRFRFADVWRARVRKIEENFYGPILRRDPVSPERSWGLLVAEDLFHPSFKISRRTALRARLRRNYWPIYTVLVLSWGLKVLVHPAPATQWGELRDRLAMGLLPWWLPLAYVSCFLVGGALLLLLTPPAPRTEEEYWSVHATAGEPVALIDL
jgi:uncharacterized membrane protein